MTTSINPDFEKPARYSSFIVVVWHQLAANGSRKTAPIQISAPRCRKKRAKWAATGFQRLVLPDPQPNNPEHRLVKSRRSALYHLTWAFLLLLLVLTLIQISDNVGLMCWPVWCGRAFDAHLHTGWPAARTLRGPGLRQVHSVRSHTRHARLEPPPYHIVLRSTGTPIRRSGQYSRIWIRCSAF